MRYKHIEFVNFGIHRKLTITPSPRLTGIIGRNGTGKSTILAGLEWLVSGSIPTQGKKESNVAQLAPPRAKSYVAGTIEHGGFTLEVVRALQGKTTTQLKIDGGEAIEGETKVNAAMADVFGHASTLFGDYVFVKQSDIYAFLDLTEAVRAKAFSHLFGTRKAAKVYDLAGKRRSAINVAPRSVSLDTVRRQLADAYQRLSGLRENLARYAHLKGYSVDNDPDAALVARYKRYKVAKVELPKAKLARKRLRRNRASAIAVMTAAIKEQTEFEAHAEVVSAEVHAATINAAAWSAWRQWERTAANLRRRQLQASTDFDACVNMQLPVVSSKFVVAEVEAEIDALRLRIAEYRELIENFDNDVAACPTCGTPVAEFAHRVDVARACIADDSAALTRLQSQIKSHTKSLRVIAEHKANRIRLSADVDRATDELAMHEAASQRPTTPESGDVALATTTVADTLRRIKLTRNDKAAASDAARRAVGRFDGLLEAATTHIHAVRVEIAATRLPVAEYRDASARLAETSVGVKSRSVIRGELRAVRAGTAELEQTLAVLEAEAAAAAKAASQVAQLDGIRAVLHATALPKIVANGYLALIEGGVNRLLAAFAAGFQIKASADLSFVVLFPDGRSQPAIRLSMGQKVLLALAFRVEVNSLFAGEVGMLCLDEPTLALDSQNVGCLEVALTALGSLSDSSGLQCVLVTHEQRLCGLFDHVVSL